jgi:hypothetical protein
MVFARAATSGSDDTSAQIVAVSVGIVIVLPSE